ncbi:hypothetical protein [Cyclobacterium salsum]|uniref:hypothetical protein n=1 Tax=Cyclobacterium salsum TaxID=2666329 RepID=UPI0013912E28|nr:hypothetical protein [Cyclobacterium salsum]
MKKLIAFYKINLLILLFSGFYGTLSGQEASLSEKDAYWMPGAYPDRIILNLTENPTHSIAVNWRTSADVSKGEIEWAEASDGAKMVV